MDWTIYNIIRTREKKLLIPLKLFYNFVQKNIPGELSNFLESEAFYKKVSIN